jgi:hypothetical protein
MERRPFEELQSVFSEWIQRVIWVIEHRGSITMNDYCSFLKEFSLVEKARRSGLLDRLYMTGDDVFSRILGMSLYSEWKDISSSTFMQGRELDFRTSAIMVKRPPSEIFAALRQRSSLVQTGCRYFASLRDSPRRNSNHVTFVNILYVSIEALNLSPGMPFATFHSSSTHSFIRRAARTKLDNGLWQQFRGVFAPPSSQKCHNSTISHADSAKSFDPRSSCSC